jgi:transcriptional regulator with XRE-family HTH domain
MVQIPRLREWREMRALTQVELAELANVSSRSVAGYEAGAGARPPTVRKLAEALSVEVADLREDPDSPKAEAPPSPQLTLNGALEEERRTAWESAVENARRLQEAGQGRMAELLSAWRASKERGEVYNVRRRYLDAMGVLLQHAYDAETALVEALSGARLAQQWPEVQKADRFYIELWRLVQGAGLSIRTDGEQAVEHVQSQERPDRVEEPRAA